MSAHSPEAESTTYLFGPFRLVPKRQLLLRNGVPVRIGGRALDILSLLVRRPGEVVTKKELLEFGWQNTFVHESNLKVNIAALRRVLSNRAAEIYIATVSGRGYRFVERVEVEQTTYTTASRIHTGNSRPLPKARVLIGRDSEIACLASKISVGRCLTIAGPGGVGKTTIALAVIRHVSETYADGVSFIDLSTVGDPQYATAAIAAGVGVRQRSEDTLTEIIDLLHDRQMLLVLDNCEHLLSTMTTIVERMLASLPTITILATSREPLRASSEDVHCLRGLGVPEASQVMSAKDALDFGAIQLFVARARERGSYTMGDAEAPLVSAICRRLDGIPQAIELAACKMQGFGPSALLTMLEENSLQLSNGESAAPLRKQPLLATLDWSYGLLSEGEAALLRHLSVFAGVFRAQDAVAMSALGDFDATQTIDALERLTSKSLVCAEMRDSVLTYRLLRRVRGYAVERLADTGQRDRALRRHARHVLELFERASEESEWREKRDWMAEYGDRVDDLRNAIAWAFGPTGNRMLGIRLTAAAIPLWKELSSLSEMQSRVERALLAARDLGDCPSDLTMKLIAARAFGLTFAQHFAVATEAAWHECYELGIETQSPKYQLFGLWGLISHLTYSGRPLQAIERLSEFKALAESQSDWSAVAEGDRMLATAEIYVGKIGSARRRLERLVERFRRPRDPVRFARFQAERGVAIRCSLALVLWISGQPRRAMQVALSAVERAEASGHVVSHSNALAVFAIPIAYWTGDYEGTAEFLNVLEENGRRDDIGIWREVCRFFKSALRAKRQEAGAAAEMRAGLHDLIATGNVLRAPMHYSMVAEALFDAGAIEDARALIEEANALATEQVANWCLPEILRIAGLIELQSGYGRKAEQLLRRSIAEASTMGALTLELRAALSLFAKLLSDGHRDDAVDLLKATCAKFREDETFRDLEEARACIRTSHTLGNNKLVV
jgi:predicted ATPase/DNA-binding winged helix-turn-helix (wHTH) protein